MENKYKLSDEAIAQIAKYLQLAILTGTDIVDNLRLLELSVNESGTLSPSEECAENFDSNIEKLVNQKPNATLE